MNSLNTYNLIEEISNLSKYFYCFNQSDYHWAAGASERLGEGPRHESHLIPLVLRRALGEESRQSAIDSRQNYERINGKGRLEGKNFGFWMVRKPFDFASLG